MHLVEIQDAMGAIQKKGIFLSPLMHGMGVVSIRLERERGAVWRAAYFELWTNLT